VKTREIKNIKKYNYFNDFSLFVMGKTFLQHPGGARLYSCAKCDTVLTNKSQLISMV
jgi:LSD1 subclass zinc finger protein